MALAPHRRILPAFAAVAALVAAAVFAPVGAKAVPAPRRAIVNLSSFADQTTTVPATTPDPLANNVGPGSHLLISMAGGLYGCTANYIWRDASSGKLYLGAAGHCFLPAGKTATAGPGADYSASATSVRVCISGCYFGGETGFSLQGTTVALGPVAYARQTENGQDVGNDFGVVEIPSGVTIRNNMPVWGGPSGTTATGVGDLLCLYGNGVGLGETAATKARAGLSEGATATYWAAALPSTPGDSGSAVDTCNTGATPTGKAVGILTHIAPGYGGIVGTTVAQAHNLAGEAGLNLSVQTA